MKISRQAYSELYGPTVGDSVRLGDTNLWVSPESDHAVPGEEVTFGGGKVIRDGMGQSQAADSECMDLVITNALIVDYSAVVKADVGVKHGRLIRACGIVTCSFGHVRHCKQGQVVQQN